MLGELENITCGEMEALKRRRSGKSTKQWADENRRSYSTQVRREADTMVYGDEAALKELQGIQPFERCWLYRHRVGKTVTQVAKEMKLSRMTVQAMELGRRDPTDLLCYWEA